MMKKIFIKEIFFLPVLILTLFFSINKVSADTVGYATSYYSNYEFYSRFSTDYSEQLSYMINWYNTNYSNDYDYYFIYGSYYDEDTYQISLLVSSTNVIQALNYGDTNRPQFNINDNSLIKHQITYNYNASSGDNGSYSTNEYGSLNNLLIYDSNSTVVFAGSSCVNNNYPCFDKVTLPGYTNLALDVAYPVTNLTNNSTVPTYVSLVNGPSSNFIEVNLSDYDYIILSLKNYNQSPFNTTIYSLGSLCFTPVYNYGMTQKNEIFPGYQVMACTEEYTSMTPVTISILQSDLDNNSVYYIKKSNSSTNIVKIPTSVFDITYINSNNTDPQVSIGGRSYPVIPFNNLTDTANKSTDEGYVSGASCALGDVNCQYNRADFNISDLFSQPIELLKSVWANITTVFTLVASFITILPPTLQTFLYLAFMISIIIGILKIIL